MNEALRDWIAEAADTFYVIGTVAGPHPYPMLVREFQSIIGREARGQILRVEGKAPNYLIACVGGGSNALGLFAPFLADRQTKMIAVEAGGHGVGRNAASLENGVSGVLHGSKTYVLQNAEGQIANTHSLAPGLDYPGVGPELSYWKDLGRITTVSIRDEEALEGMKLLAETEGIIPALESAHAVAYLRKLAPRLDGKQVVVINISGRGDKDLQTVEKYLGNDRI